MSRVATGAPTAAPKRVCMVSHSFYESDNRIIRYAEALAERGDIVEIIALRRSPEQPIRETLNGVLVHRVQDRFGKVEGSRWSYLWPLLRFLVTSSRWLTAQQKACRFDSSMSTTFRIFWSSPPGIRKLRGARLILDIHDIVPEFFASKFGTRPRSRWSACAWMEKVSAAFADHVILANHLWLETSTPRVRPASEVLRFHQSRR